MTAQPITGLGSEIIAASYAPANHRLGKLCYPSMQYSQNTPYKRAAEAQKDKEGEGRDFSGSLA